MKLRKRNNLRLKKLSREYKWYWEMTRDWGDYAKDAKVTEIIFTPPPINRENEMSGPTWPTSL